MNKKSINKDQLLDNFYDYILTSNNPPIIFSKTKNKPVVYFGIHNGEYRFYANKENNRLEIESYFTNKPDNYQTHATGFNTAFALNIPRSIYEMIEQIINND